MAGSVAVRRVARRSTRMRAVRFLALFLFATTAYAGEYRAYWVDTFNTPFATQADVDRIVDAAARSNANAVFVQVRRRGDSFYLDSREPIADALRFATVDPLQYLIEQAHARGIEVHAFVIVGAVYNRPATDPPTDPTHVFLQHIWNAETGSPYTDDRQWGTRTSGTSPDGYRFGNDWYIDLGHPDAAAYTIDVLTYLARHYAIDGVHLDRIRYPESPVTNVGYNPTSVARFNERYGRSGDPAMNDPLWSDWRREQVTGFVRRLYFALKTIRPSIRVSAALITFSNGPAASGGFQSTEPYWRVFQDWERWAREGILDIIIPMIYRREHDGAQAAQFDDWLRFTVETAHASGRLAVAGIAAYLNGVEGTVRQARDARAAGADGVIFYSFATTSAAVTANPFSLPAPFVSTPARSLEEFIRALTQGGYELPALTPLFATPDPPPPITVPSPRRRAVQH